MRDLGAVGRRVPSALPNRHLALNFERPAPAVCPACSRLTAPLLSLTKRLMPVLATSPSSRGDRSYFIALGLVVALAVGEVLAALIHLSAKTRAERVTAPAATSAPMMSDTAGPAVPNAVLLPFSPGIPP